MRCDSAQRSISASLDGQRLDDAAAAHLRTCARCQSFLDTAQRLRTVVRVQAAEQVPDLTSTIMAQVGSGEVTPLRRLPSPRRSLGAAVAAAAVIGVLVGYASFGGLSGGPTIADAGDIAHDVRLASGNVSAYQANYSIVEFSGDGESRQSDLEIDFASPERYRMKVTDPSAAAGELGAGGELRVDEDSWWIKGGRICPQVEECRGGWIGVRGTTLVTGRPPFDPGAPMPTDIVLPVSSLAGTDALDVVGPRVIGDRDAALVQLPATEAEPLLSSLQQVGTWRPIWGQDRVSIWLDTDSWIPLQIEVNSAGSAQRAAWSARLGLPAARAGDLVLRATLTHLSLEAPPSSVFSPGSADLTIDEGFREVPVSDIRAETGFEPLVPTVSGLSPWRSGVFEDSQAAVLSFAKGLRWLRVIESQQQDRPSPFAQQVAVPNGGVGYYEASTGGEPRRLSLFTPKWHLTFEGNVTRQELLDAAGSISLRGQRVDDEPFVALGDLSERFGRTLLLPTTVPYGAHPVASGVSSSMGTPEMQLAYSRSEVEPGGYALRVYETEARSIPPAPGSDLISVQVRGRTGRWSPTQHELEWLEDGLYVSLKAPSLELPIVLRIADDMRPSA